MIQLFINEQYEEDVKFPIPYDRQLFKVRLHIEKALLKLKKKKRYIDSYSHFSPFSIKLKKTKNANDLMKVVNASFGKIIELENKLKSSA